METRGRKLGRRQDSKGSRDSSVSSTSREVRCGCQYFQSDSLLPERHTLVGTRPSSRNMGDHEYEPINPPASQSASPPLLKVTDQEGQEKTTEPERIDFTPIINSSKHQYLRIPLNMDMVIPLDKAEVESIRYDDDEEEEIKVESDRKVTEVCEDLKADQDFEVHKDVDVSEDIEVPEDMEVPVDQEMSAQEIQDRMEERYFAATPSTTVSRTDGEFNTSQMDSSGLDELPLKRDARRGFNAKGFQQRMQSQAGRLRSRIRNMSRPKFNFPDRPKLHLPEKPKFNFPERPKFNFKRPDLKMPNLSFGKTKTSSIRRPLRDRAQVPSNQSTVGSKKNIFDSINFRTYPRIFSKKKKANQGRRALTPPPRMETESTPPSSPASRTGPFNQRWSHRFKDIQFADDDTQSDLKKPSFDDEVEDDSAAFHEPDFRAAVTLTNNKQIKAASSTSIPGSDKEQHSSGSSSERHRAGVIEEIDSDEFFLREKGLSREDVDVSRYLSLEIRDAFRSTKNALASLDKEEYDDNEDYKLKPPQRSSKEPIRHSMEAIRNQSLEQIRMTPERDIDLNRQEEEMEPVRPERARSLKKRSTRSRSEELKPEKETQFNTFPPNRPTRERKQRSQSKQSIPPDGYDDPDKENMNETMVTNRRPPSVPSLAITDTTKEPSPTRYIDESSEALNEPLIGERQPPLPPKRRKSMRESSQDNESLSARRYNRDRWIDDVHDEDMVLDQEIALQRRNDHRPTQNGYYDTPPSLPMRKSRSRGTSLADEDRTSRGADSLVSETRTHLTEDFPVDIRSEVKAFYQDCDYAVVEKTVIEVEPKFSTIENTKPIRPPPPSRKKKTVAHLTALKNQGIHFFYTYPRRAIKKSLHKQPLAPTRPVRNYSSIGPARPPRRNRVFREPVYEGEFIPLRDENEVVLDDKDKFEFFDSEKIDSMLLEAEAEEKINKTYEQDELQDIRDLQSGDVIEKMKGRPLPPPPRPPRKSKDDNADLEDEDRDIDLDAEVTDLDAEDEVVVERIDIFVSPSRRDEVRREKSASIVREDHPIEEFCEWEEEPELKAPLPKPVEKSKETVEQEKYSTEPPVKSERRKKSLSVARRAATPVSPIEATVSTQTDTLPEGFYVEEEQQTTGEYSKSEETTTKLSQPETEKQVPVEKRVETIVEHKVVVIPTPETEILKAKKIHVAELEVEKLNVAELQAKKITVSDIDGVSMQVTELISKSGHLVVSGIDLPSSFLEAIAPPPPPPTIIQIQSSTQTPPETVDSQTNTTPQEEPPVRQFVVEVVAPKPQPTQDQTASKPVQEAIVSKTIIEEEHKSKKSVPVQEVVLKPQYVPETTTQSSPAPIPTPLSSQKRPSPPPPAIVIQTPHGQSSSAYVPDYIPSSPPPCPPPRVRALGHDSEDELRMLPRRRRHHSHKHSPQYSSDEEDEGEYPSFPIARRTHQRELTSNELIRQLLNIWQTSFMRGVNHVVDGLNSAFPEGEKRKDAQTAACIVLVLLAGLIMLGFGSDKTVHHHHWDFLPPNL